MTTKEYSHLNEKPMVTLTSSMPRVLQQPRCHKTHKTDALILHFV